MMVIGLTGGIGSGKTIVSNFLEILGCVIYNSDDVAKQLYADDDIKTKVIHLFGEQAYQTNSLLNKNYISEKIFSNPQLLTALNNIIHPAVNIHFTNFIKKYPSKIIVKETALLFEIGLQTQMDFTIIVTAPKHVKINRVISRNKLSVAEIEKIMQNQWSDERKIPLANFCIFNDDAQAIIPQVLAVHKQLIKHC